MADVFFRIDEALGEQDRAEFLSRVIALPGVKAAAPLRAHSPNPRWRSLFFARVDDTADAERIAKSLREMPEVSSTELPARRSFI